MTDFRRNNLDAAISPYLRQHDGNPVWWQSWSPEVLSYASRAGKPLFVSVGYSTCHWCHVMASEAFSDPGCAAILNEEFVAIKVDREERPDIDQLLMGFLVATTGRGGWPLNVFLSPDVRPFFAMTYASTEERFGIAPFAEILRRAAAFYGEHKDGLAPFSRYGAGPASGYSAAASLPEPDGEGRLFRGIDASLAGKADREYGGLRGAPKFPPHTALLYATHRLAEADERERSAPLDHFVRTTLDAMASRGLHDFVGGGLFRYCVDERWTIPHFEKMLYDQALGLWNFSVASRLYSSSAYALVARRIVECLRRDFLEDGLFCAAIDADTEHAEGKTYLWSMDELRSELSEDRLTLIRAAFDLREEGNFEGSNHLVSREGIPAAPEILAILAELLGVRGARIQPFKDRKKLTAWNSLAGIGLLQAARHAGDDGARELAERQLDALMGTVSLDDGVAHGSLEGRMLGGRFLSDHAALLLLLTYHQEDRRIYAGEIDSLRRRVGEFRRGGIWMEAMESDFLPVPAEEWDNPFPASAALAEAALSRAAMVRGEAYDPVAAGRGTSYWRHFSAHFSSGAWYTVSGTDAIPWSALPICVIQGEGERLQYCRRGSCTPGLPPAGIYPHAE